MGPHVGAAAKGAMREAAGAAAVEVRDADRRDAVIKLHRVVRHDAGEGAVAHKEHAVTHLALHTHATRRQGFQGPSARLETT